MDYLVKTKLLSKTQFGFRPKFSTTDALLYAIETWRTAMDKGDYTAVASLDLSKAFDSVDHNILLSKLVSLGFLWPARMLISNYLSERKQAVFHNGVSSNWLTVVRGVPQGTILGPLLFLLYVNDLADNLKECLNAQYADDTLVFNSNSNITDAVTSVSRDCEALTKYFSMNKLQLNVSKTDFLLLNPKRTIDTTTLAIGCSRIVPATDIKYLGVVIDEKLSFDSFVKQTLKKMAMGIKSIRHIANRIPLSARIQLLHALVLSHYNYGCTLLSDLSQENKTKLERQLNWGLRVCYQKPIRHSCNELRLNARILSPSLQTRYFTQCKFYGLVYKTLPAFLSLQFPNFNFDVNAVRDKRSKTLTTLRFKKHFIQNCFLNVAINDWNSFIKHMLSKDKYKGFGNSLLDDLEAMSYKTFKKLIFGYFFEQQFDPVVFRLRQTRTWDGFRVQHGI